MNRNITSGVVLMIWLSVTLACTVSVPVLNVGPLEEQTLAEAVNGATLADVQLLIGTGELKVSSGADGLIEGILRYNVKEWKPQIERNRVGNLASILIRQGTDEKSWGIAGQGARNEWDIRLGGSVPVRLTVGMGAGTNILDLGGVRLARLKVDCGAGDTTLTFNTPNPEPLSEIQVNAGAGKIDMRSMGNANFERLNIKGGAGEVVLDLNGDWARPANVEVIAGVGKLQVRVPREIGVRVTPTGSPVGKLVVDGLITTGGSYVNEAYATATIKLEIALTTGVGDVTITTR